MTRHIKLYICILLSLATASSCSDDEKNFSLTPAIGFETTEGSITETDENGIQITLYTNVRLSEEGTATVEVNNIGGLTYGVDYTTEPAAIDNVITVPLGSEITSPSFYVFPVATGEERLLGFTLTAVSGNSLSLGQQITRNYTLKITKDEVAENTVTIASVRAQYTGAATDLVSNKFIEGVVISSNDNVTARNVFIQDASGGIVLRFNEENQGSFVPGDKVLVPLNGVTLTAFNGLIQLGNGSTTLPKASVTKLGAEPLPTPVTITLTQLNSNQYQSQLVKVEGVTFTSANGTALYANNNTITDGSVNSVVRIENYAPFKSNVIPQGSRTITGVAGYFNAAQLIPMAASDIQ
jgi:hypothetical protein